MTVKRKKLKGSILGLSVLLLSLFLFSGLTLMTVAVVERKASFSTQKSIIAFQAADSAAERVLARIYRYNSPALLVTPLGGAMTGDATIGAMVANLQATSGAACASGVVSGTNNNAPPAASPSYTFQVTFLNQAGTAISCADAQWRDKLIRIRAEGFYQRTSRVLEVGIRPRT